MSLPPVILVCGNLTEYHPLIFLVKMSQFWYGSSLIRFWRCKVGMDSRRDPLFEVNEKCVELLVEMADGTSKDVPFVLVPPLLDVLRAMDSGSRRRAGRCPFLVVDIGFRDEVWWRELKGGFGRVSKQASRVGNFPRRQAVHLARSTLTLAWHVAQSDELDGALMLGMSVGCQEVIRSLGLAELEEASEKLWRHVRPRWEDQPAVWRQLLTAAMNNDAQQAADVTMRGLQLLVGDMLQVPRNIETSGA
jgi:hypothetical protein